jgi:Fe-S oxidoreductase
MNAGVDLVATSCPYCLAMVEDGIKNQEMADRITVLDLGEILYRSIL